MATKSGFCMANVIALMGLPLSMLMAAERGICMANGIELMGQR
jgi:hypothetical protein